MIFFKSDYYCSFYVLKILFEAIALSAGILGKRFCNILLLLWIIPTLPGPLHGTYVQPLLIYLSTWDKKTHLVVQPDLSCLYIRVWVLLHCAYKKEMENIIMMMKADTFF